MAHKQWEAIIQSILDESNQQPKEAGKHRVFMAWRAKLEKEPTLLAPYQIDGIVREVRRRLEASASGREHPLPQHR